MSKEKLNTLGALQKKAQVFVGEISPVERKIIERLLSCEDDQVIQVNNELEVEYGEVLGLTKKRMRDFFATLECSKYAKPGLLLGALQSYAAEEPETEEIVRGAVADVMETTVPALQLQDPIAQFLSSLTRNEIDAIEIRRNFDLEQCNHGSADMEALDSFDRKLRASGLTYDVVIARVLGTDNPALEETAPIPVQQQDPVAEGFSAKAIRGRKMTASPWGGRLQAPSPAQPVHQSVTIIQKPGTAAFSAKGAIRGRQMTFSPWQGEVGDQLLEVVTPFFKNFIKTAEDRNVLIAVLCMENPNDPKELERLIRENARPDAPDAFMRMNFNITSFIKRLGRPAEEVRKAMWLKLGGGMALPADDRPQKDGVSSRNQLTIPSANTKRGALARILGPKRKGRRKK